MKKKSFLSKSKVAPKIISAPVSEIFFSYQGEGARAGEPEIFVRVAGCNLNCNYCDTPSSRISKNGKLLSVNDTLKKILAIRKKHPQTRTISITGGEPLLYPEFVHQIASRLKKIGLKVLLETNATIAPAPFKKIISRVDFVSADIKLPSTLNKSRRSLTDGQSLFLKKIPPRKLYIKIPITSDVSEEEFARALKIIRETTPTIVEVFIQPVTSTDTNSEAAPMPPVVFKLKTLARKILGPRRQIHITPQMHKLLWKMR